MRRKIILALMTMLGLGACSTQFTDEDFGEPANADDGSGGDTSTSMGGMGGGSSLACEDAGLTCGEFEECSTGGSDPECVCIEGHTGADCTECEAGYQDNDSNGSCLPTCEGNDCSDVGTCDDSSGEAICDCEGLRAGATCERCTAGYELQDNGSCEWVGGIVKNGKFDDDTAWTFDGETNHVDSGEFGRLSADAQCSGGAITQQVEMPAVDAAQPMLLRFKAWASGTKSRNNLQVRLGEVVYPVDENSGGGGLATSPPPAANNEFCVGPGSLGGTRTLSFQPAEFPTTCDFNNVLIDNVEIVLDESGVCPTENGITNRSFNTTEAWTLENEATISGGSAHLVTSNQCSATPQINQRVQIPSSAQEPASALKVTYHTGDGSGGSTCTSDSCRDRLHVDLLFDNGAAHKLGILQTTPFVTTTDTICIPQRFRGAVTDLRFEVTRGGCAAVYGYDTEIEAVDLTDDPACEDVKGIFNGNFEANSTAAPAAAWERTVGGISVVTGGDAPEGDNYMNFDSSCVGTIRTPFITPRANSDGGAALIFQYQHDSTDATFEACSGAGCVTLDASSTWKEQILCVDPLSFGPGITNELTFGATDAGGCTAADLWLDDIHAGVHEDCN